MHQEPKYWAVLPAAGAGSRMAAEISKQYLGIGQQTVIEYSLDALLSCKQISAVVVVTAADDERWPSIQAHYRDRPVDTVTGGTERCHSVLNGLDHLTDTADDDDWVLVHDAARPCLRSSDVDTLINILAGDSVGGLLGVPVADTMKRVNDELSVVQTVMRVGLWHGGVI